MGGETDSNDFPQIVQVVSDEDEVKPDVPLIYSGINFKKNFYLFMAVLGLCCCTWTFSSCGEWGLLSSCAWASPHHASFCYRAWDPEHRLSSYGTQT